MKTGHLMALMDVGQLQKITSPLMMLKIHAPLKELLSVYPMI